MTDEESAVAAARVITARAALAAAMVDVRNASRKYVIEHLAPLVGGEDAVINVLDAYEAAVRMSASPRIAELESALRRIGDRAARILAGTLTPASVVGVADYDAQVVRAVLGSPPATIPGTIPETGDDDDDRPRT